MPVCLPHRSRAPRPLCWFTGLSPTASWNKLIPTLEKAGSKVEWVTTTQGVLNSRALSQPVTHVACHNVLSYVVVEVPSSHVAILSYPQVVADLIIKAAK